MSYSFGKLRRNYYDVKKNVVRATIKPTCLIACILFLFSACDNGSGPAGTTIPPAPSNGRIIDHRHSSLTGLSEANILLAKEKLHIGYGHTSHGSQISDGLSGVDEFKGNTGLYSISSTGASGALHLYEGSGDLSGDGLAYDVGSYPGWINETEDFLGEPNAAGRGSAHREFNVIMWSWCGQLSDLSTTEVKTQYLDPMAALELKYPGVVFVYMTGHADGTGLAGTLHKNNQQIRSWCIEKNKWLFDFYDIECYDPDGKYYGDKNVDDACNYKNGSTTKNWATEWQAANPAKWFNCGSAHSEPVNANMKAFAAWQLFSAIAKAL